MSQGFTREWLIGAIDVISEVIVLHGTVYAPWLDRLERELALLDARDDPLNRAKAHLARRSRAPHHTSEATHG